LDLDTAATVIVAHVFTDGERPEAGLRAGQLPSIVGRGQVVKLGADEDHDGGEQRPLEAEGVPRVAGRCFVRQVSGDVRVVEVPVIEDGPGEP
jgi:hypothetical protein